MREWTEFATSGDAYQSMIRDDQTGEMRRVLAELLDSGGDERARRRRLQTAAATHGLFRRAQRCSEDVLARDFAAAREVIQGVVRRFGLSYTSGEEVARTLSSDCCLAHLAAQAAYEGLMWQAWEFEE
jgi:hypothetical protein